jgi:hypothetical protein
MWRCFGVWCEMGEDASALDLLGSRGEDSDLTLGDDTTGGVCWVEAGTLGVRRGDIGEPGGVKFGLLMYT